MREIKFRAWDIDYKCFEYFGFNELDKMSIFWGHDGLAENAVYEYQQYTGLKDKNGVDIYEGDIVKSTLIDTDGRLQSIYWRDDLCGWSIPGESHAEYYEVIGNIYENPDLISQEESNGV